MPKYLKNKRKRRHSAFKNRSENIIMSSENSGNKSSKPQREKQSFTILHGKKKSSRIKRIVALSLIGAIVLSVSLISIISPTGISELISNYTATFSFNSKLPVTLNGSETYNVSFKNNSVFVLSDSDFSCYSKQGKFSYSDAHGFSSPVAVESQARCLVYDQNGKGVKIYNAKQLLLNFDCEYNILGADISRNGYFAVATKSQNYTSMVTVYNKNGEVIYQWYCPEEIINAVAVSSNGKKIALCTLGVNNGNYNSKLYVLEFNSPDPVFQKEYSNALIYGIDSTSTKSFTVIGENFCDIISWKKHSVTTFTTPYSVDGVKSSNKYTVIESAREHNDGNATFTVYNNKREQISSFDFDGSVDDFVIYGKNIMVLSRNKVFLINSDGNIAKTGDTTFGIVRIVPTSSGGCLTISHNNISKISLE